MKITLKLSPCFVVLHCALSLPINSQVENTGCGPVSGFGCNGNCENEPPEEHMFAPILLKQRGVSLTRYSLLLALSSHDPQVRYLAAWSLADQNAKGNVQTSYLGYFANQSNYLGWLADEDENE